MLPISAGLRLRLAMIFTERESILKADGMSMKMTRSGKLDF
jgi:hypothetical protein